MELKSLARSGAWIVAGLFFGKWGVMRRLRSGSRQPPPLMEVRSILAIRLDLVGDLVFTLPAIQVLREGAPNARISLLALPYTADLARNLPYIDRVITADVNRWRRPGEWIRGRAWAELRQVVAAIRAEKPDLCVSFYGRVGASFALLSGARFLVGYRSEGYASTFDLAVAGKRYRQRRHETEYCLDLARALGLGHVGSDTWERGRLARPGCRPSAGCGPEARAPSKESFCGVALARPGTGKILRADTDATARVDGLLLEAGVSPSEPLVALHPGALNTPIKRWLPERWAAVADRIQSELGYRVVLVGSAAELPLAEAVQRQMSSLAVVLAGRTSLVDLVALLSRCCLFLGGDSGPLHVASALGVPSVSVFGPTDPAITGPVLAPGIRQAPGIRDQEPGTGDRAHETSHKVRGPGGRVHGWVQQEAETPWDGAEEAGGWEVGTGSMARVLTARAECIPCYDPGRQPECRRGDILCMSLVTVDEVFDAAKEALDRSCLERRLQGTNRYPA